MPWQMKKKLQRKSSVLALFMPRLFWEQRLDLPTFALMGKVWGKYR